MQCSPYLRHKVWCRPLAPHVPYSFLNLERREQQGQNLERREQQGQNLERREQQGQNLERREQWQNQRQGLLETGRGWFWGSSTSTPPAI
jgi:hypothetical protein